MRVLTRWDESLTKEESNELSKQLASWHLSKVTKDSTSWQCLTNSVTNSDHYQLCNFSLPYNNGLTPSDARHLRQVTALFSKRADLDIGVDKERVAREAFEAAESLCKESNLIFSQCERGLIQFKPRIEAVFHGAQRKIASILGRRPSLSELDFRFGPGATTALTRRNASARRKLGMEHSCSEDLFPIASAILEEMPAWIPFGDSDTALVGVQITDSRLAFVPKSAKTFRSIAVEPSLNQMFQLGVGDHIASRLRRVGIDIKDQTRNQRLAREGSITGALATLDLSSASDTISIGIVRHLLPLDWYSLLKYGRSGHYMDGDRRCLFSKFSSMGNGFTFPLETLIFYALSVASCEALGLCTENVSVYGDDIIIPTEGYDLLKEVLHASGFLLNTDKSFYSGEFRESCGADYLSGIDIRPCYVKDIFDCSSLFVLHNFYVRHGMEEPASLIRDYFHPSLRIFGPDGYGDGHLLGEWKPLAHGRSKGWCGYTFETFSWKGRKDFRPYPGDFVYPAYCIYRNPPRHGLPDLPVKYAPRLNSGIYSSGGNLLYNKFGCLGVSLPGTKGYKLISIYTLLG